MRRKDRAPTPEGRKEPRLHAMADALTGVLLLGAVVFSPWAFGTTQEWSMWTMNVTGYCVGVLLGLKTIVRRRLSWSPGDPSGRISGRLLASITVLVLGYILMSGLNARAVYDVETGAFQYRRCIPWLPHSYDQFLTLGLFWNYLGLACFFWAGRDWLLSGQSAAEGERRGRLPYRLRLLLWMICINTALVALEGLVQRAWWTNRLLWLVRPTINATPEAQFGPYAYRSNAAQLFNLVWPVCLGLWWSLQGVQKPGRSRGYHVLLSCVLVLVVSTFFSLSRGASIVAVVSLLWMAVLLLMRLRRLGAGVRLGILSLVVGALGFAAVLAWTPLANRFERGMTEFQVQRVDVWAKAWPIARENFLFGCGPGTMTTILQLAPGLPPEQWYAQLHNDPLEFLATFGIAGSLLLFVGLGTVMIRPLLSGGVAVPRMLVYSLWIGLGGLFAHSVGDFPLQIYSLLLMVVIYAAVLSTVTRR